MEDLYQNLLLILGSSQLIMKTIICGIYRFKNILTGICYIGQSIDINKRKKQHLTELRLNRHHCSYFQNSFNKHGEENFTHEVLEICFSNLNEREQFWINFHEDIGVYNHAKVAGSPKGIKRSQETKDKQSALKLGRKISEETKAKMRISQAAAKEVKSAKAKAQWSDPVALAAISEKRKGKVTSDETKAKISATSLERWANNEYKEKLSLIQKEAQKSNAKKKSQEMKIAWADPEYRQKMINSRKKDISLINE